MTYRHQDIIFSFVFDRFAEYVNKDNGKGEKPMNSLRNGKSPKKWAAGSLLLLSLLSAAALSAEEKLLPCQMLLSEAEQRELGFARQRAMYVPSRAKRLAAISLREGADLMRKEELAKAMEELNRAWRFDPTHPYSYWLAGILRGMEAARLTDPDLQKKCFDDSLKLFDRAAAIIEPSPKRELKENLALDRAETLIRYGIFLKKENPAEAAERFRQAELILKNIVPGQDARGGALSERIREMRSRMNAAKENSGSK